MGLRSRLSLHSWERNYRDSDLDIQAEPISLNIGTFDPTQAHPDCVGVRGCFWGIGP